MFYNFYIEERERESFINLFKKITHKVIMFIWKKYKIFKFYQYFAIWWQYAGYNYWNITDDIRKIDF